MDRVGVIGLGKMGLPIARNLIEQGFSVIGYRRSGSPELAEAGEGGRQPGRDQVRKKNGDLLDCPISGSPGMVAPRLATTFASGDPDSVEAVSKVLDAISGPWVYTGAFGTGAQLKYIANLLLAVHTVAAAEAIALARRSGLNLELVQKTLDTSIASSAIWTQRGPLMAGRHYTPAPGPVRTLHPVLEQIADHAIRSGLDTPVFTAAKQAFDQVMADGWGELDIACVHDQVDPQ